MHILSILINLFKYSDKIYETRIKTNKSIGYKLTYILRLFVWLLSIQLVVSISNSNPNNTTRDDRYLRNSNEKLKSSREDVPATPYVEEKKRALRLRSTQRAIFRNRFSKLKNVYGGNCVVVKDKLYYLGGQWFNPEKISKTPVVETEKSKLVSSNHVNSDDQGLPKGEVLAMILDLSKPFQLINVGSTFSFTSVAPWKDISDFDNPSTPPIATASVNHGGNNKNQPNSSTSPMYSQIVATNSNNGTGEVLIFGGAGAKRGQELLIFNTTSLTFKPDLDGSNYAAAPLKSRPSVNPDLLSPLAYGSWVRSDIDPDQYILYGGLSLINGTSSSGGGEALSNVANLTVQQKFSDNRVFSFDLKTHSWTIISSNTDKAQFSFLHSSFVYQNKMYLLGGIHPYSFDAYSWDHIRTFDLKTKQWSNTSLLTNGVDDIPQPRFGHRTVFINNTTLAILGGAIGLKNETKSDNKTENVPTFADDILLLDITKWTWTRIQPEGFQGTYLGCAALVGDYLIYAFGQSTSPLSGPSKTILIDTRTWNSVTSFEPQPPKVINVDTTDAGSSTLQNGLVIGGVCLLIAIIIGLVFYVLMLYRRKRKVDLPPMKEKSNSNSFPSPPSPIGNLWLEPSNEVDNLECTESNFMNISSPANDSTPSLLKPAEQRIRHHLESLDNGDITIPAGAISSRSTSVNRHQQLLSLKQINEGVDYSNSSMFPPNVKFETTQYVPTAGSSDYTSGRTTFLLNRSLSSPEFTRSRSPLSSVRSDKVNPLKAISPRVAPLSYEGARYGNTVQLVTSQRKHTAMPLPHTLSSLNLNENIVECNSINNTDAIADTTALHLMLNKKKSSSKSPRFIEQLISKINRGLKSPVSPTSSEQAKLKANSEIVFENNSEEVTTERIERSHGIKGWWDWKHVMDATTSNPIGTIPTDSGTMANPYLNSGITTTTDNPYQPNNKLSRLQTLKMQNKLDKLNRTESNIQLGDVGQKMAYLDKEANFSANDNLVPTDQPIPTSSQFNFPHLVATTTCQHPNTHPNGQYNLHEVEDIEIEFDNLSSKPISQHDSIPMEADMYDDSIPFETSNKNNNPVNMIATAHIASLEDKKRLELKSELVNIVDAANDNIQKTSSSLEDSRHRKSVSIVAFTPSALSIDNLSI